MAKNKINPVGVEIINYNNLRDKIYEIRGQKVMLDYDLAEIYGYTTKAFNQQVSRNLEKFDEDFRFQLTRMEVEFLSRSHFVTSMQAEGVKGGRVYLPYAFTEQGIYMLMTVLKGDLAVRQSKALIRTFHIMKNYIIQNQATLSYRDNLEIASQVAKHTNDIDKVKSKILEIDNEVRTISHQMSDAVKKSDISPIILNFTKTPESREFLILNGELAKASDTYQSIYARARHSIHIIDDYINLKALRHFSIVRPGVEITIFTDNLGRYLHRSDYLDFRHEFPKIKLRFIKNNCLAHDRFIVLDCGVKSERIFHCGASAKDAGNKLTIITELTENVVKDALNKVIETMLKNPELMLK